MRAAARAPQLRQLRLHASPLLLLEFGAQLGTLNLSWFGAPCDARPNTSVPRPRTIRVKTATSYRHRQFRELYLQGAAFPLGVLGQFGCVLPFNKPLPCFYDFLRMFKILCLARKKEAGHASTVITPHLSACTDRQHIRSNGQGVMEADNADWETRRGLVKIVSS